jgi:mRNA-degrading endonuclease YafQ of YafQ-DinJ toxin-antitoxin module
MKRIKFSKIFAKSFQKRIAPNPHLSKKFAQRMRLFEVNPRHPLLRNHALVGTKIGKRAFSITGDVRVVYGEDEDFLIFYDVGSHNQVY